MIRLPRAAPAIAAAAAIVLAACSVIAPLDEIKDGPASGGATTNGGRGGGDVGEAGSCSGSFDQAEFDRSCFR